MSSTFINLGDFDQGAAPETCGGVPAVFDPADPKCAFVVFINPLDSNEIGRINDTSRSGRRQRTDTNKVNTKVIAKAILGWQGLTAQAFVDCELLALTEQGVKDLDESLAGSNGEMAYSPAQAEHLAIKSPTFMARINELATETADLAAAKRAYERLASAGGSNTGENAGK